MRYRVVARLAGGDPYLRVVDMGGTAMLVCGRFESWAYVHPSEVLCEHSMGDLAGALACAQEIRTEQA